MEKFYTIGEFSNLTNIKVKTLQKWDRDGILVAYRTPTNRRYYTHSQYLDFIGKSSKQNEKNIVLYARVSSNKQKEDLKHQIEFLYNYSASQGYKISNFYSDIASGLNYKRKNWNRLIDDCADGKISKIIISYKDRFVRFGFDWFEYFLKSRYDVDIEIVENKLTTPEEEVIQDLITIIHVFSCRVYGLRKYESKLKKKIGDLESDE